MPEVNVVCLGLCLTLHVIFEMGSLTEFRVFPFGKTGWQLNSKDPPVSISLRQDHKSFLCFVSAGGPHSSPYACAGIPLPTEP